MHTNNPLSVGNILGFIVVGALLHFLPTFTILCVLAPMVAFVFGSILYLITINLFPIKELFFSLSAYGTFLLLTYVFTAAVMMIAYHTGKKNLSE